MLYATSAILIPPRTATTHVNPIEAGMIDMLGPAVGSQFAKATTDVPGSRNPRTGLPEYSWFSKRILKKGKKGGLEHWWNKNIKPLGKFKFSNPDVYNWGADDSPAAEVSRIDPNLFGARKRFGRGQDIGGLLEQLMGGGAKMADGGEVPDSRRLYGTNPRRKKKTVMQTSTAGMPVRGETYKKGGKVNMPKGWHV